VVDHILKDYLTLKSKKIIGDFASNWIKIRSYLIHKKMMVFIDF